MEGEQTILLKNDLDEIGRLNGVLEALAKHHDWDARALFEVQLALDELVTNIISHGYDDTFEHAIQVALAVEGGVLSLRVEDDGRPFNPLDCPMPKLDVPVEERPVGGLGVFLARKMMDQIEYHRERNRNVLLLKKRMDKAVRGQGP